ncbi:MAG TPA: NAD(P) transhydrogenase subunit alpha [Thermoanaerobaculia bacterium]|nr:NAD(P) transhydrogenase subunit alpha [Thermoanaerobaculia bacterium]
MGIVIGVTKETFAGERRVAMVPGALALLRKSGCELLLEAGAGEAAGYPDAEYTAKGGRVAGSRAEIYATAGVILQVRLLGSNPEAGRADLALLHAGQVVIGLADPLAAPESSRELAARGVTSFALELMPRITRAQSMDVLSSMATISGYKAVLLAANTLPRLFPMLMTAAGSITPARALVIGAGVAGLQAIATARRLGAVVSAYDVRPAVKEQVESVGARFVSMELDSSGSEDRGGYAKAMDESFYRRQRELMADVVKRHDVVIATAAVPGKKAPVLITRDMVAGMVPGSVIIDVAAERGGNCELTRPGETVVEGPATILGPLNLPSTVPGHASQMYARNAANFLAHLLRSGRSAIDALDTGDEITRETLVTHGGAVVHPRVRELLGMPAAQPAAAEPAEPAPAMAGTSDHGGARGAA